MNKEIFLFSWDEILGNDSVRLDFLKQKFSIDWIKTAKIEKTDDRTIIVSTEKNSLLLKLNNEKTKLNLEIDDGRTDEFITKTENNKLNIYKEIKVVYYSGSKYICYYDRCGYSNCEVKVLYYGYSDGGLDYYCEKHFPNPDEAIFIMERVSVGKKLMGEIMPTRAVKFKKQWVKVKDSKNEIVWINRINDSLTIEGRDLQRETGWDNAGWIVTPFLCRLPEDEFEFFIEPDKEKAKVRIAQIKKEFECNMKTIRGA